MKKILYASLGFALAAAFASCDVDSGLAPGNDVNPKVTVYQYTASRPYNSDNDTWLRFAANNKVSEAYYLAEKTADYESKIASMGADGYMESVVSNGTKIEGLTLGTDVDLVITDLYGDYTITTVAVGDGKKSSTTVTFRGLEWNDIVSGLYYFMASEAFASLGPNETMLQQCTTDATLYRFKDVFGEGYSLKINLMPDYTGTDADGTYTYFRIPVSETPYTYGSYGAVGCRDVGYWQGSDTWITENGYESGMYADYYCFLMIQYFVSAGNLGYGYDYFVPSE